MDEVRLVFKHNTNFLLSKAPVSFKFTRERYTPYTQLSGVIIGDIDVSKVNNIELYYQNKLLHKGMADNVSKIYRNGRYIITFLSRGFTMLLGQNEPKPGIISNSSLASIIAMNTFIPNVSWENTTSIESYIFVKEKSTIWDAICAYAYKAYKNYPYILNDNTVMASIPTGVTTFDYSSNKIMTCGECASTSSMLSKVFMSDMDGEYSYTQENADASQYNIVRKKYYPLDKQWYASPEDGLDFKLKYSNRAVNLAFVKYKGHRFENLLDKAKFIKGGNTLINNERISKVEVIGNKYGVFTNISVYRDSYASWQWVCDNGELDLSAFKFDTHNLPF